MEFKLHSKQGVILNSPANEILFGGAAGGGKSHVLRVIAILYCVQVPNLQVYLFRRLSDDLINNHMVGASGFYSMLQPLIDQGRVKITTSPTRISFWNGSKINLCHCQYEKDRFKYQGAEIHLLLIDELTHFSKEIYTYLRGRVRVSGLNIPENVVIPRIICGSNPGNIGHNWVKATFIDPAKPLEIWTPPKDDAGMLRQYVPAMLQDNPSIDYDEYSSMLQGLGNPALVRAMLNGDWNIVAGGMFDDLWNEDVHVCEPFIIPDSWHIDRSFDWGSSKPYSVGWWAESDGTDAVLPNGQTMSTVRGDLFRINELYGWNGSPNEGTKETAAEIARKIVEIEEEMGYKVNPGPADSSIYTTEDGNCIADNMENEGVSWEHANKSPGSRANGWELMRQRLKNSASKEEPGLYVFSSCRHFIRTIPVLPRDKKKYDDIDTDTEDHVADEARYRILAERRIVKSVPVQGLRF